MPPADELAPLPERGRTFRRERRVRLGDADVDGRLRLDALARYLQDVSADDTDDVGLSDGTWVVRRTLLAVHRPAQRGEALSLVTFCGGIGTRWAERRVDLDGDRGARVEAATLWVHLDPATGRPSPLPERFTACYAEAAGGRTAEARLRHPGPPTGAARHPWPLRVADLDVLGHVNNAAAWAVVEEELHAWPGRGGPMRAEVEFRAPIEAGASVERLVHRPGPDEVDVWLVPSGTADVLVSAVVRALG